MIRQILEADLLLVCSSEPRHVPGKLFEALRSNNPIIAFGDNNREVKRIIEESHSGMMFGYDKSGKEMLEQFDGKNPDNSYIKKFDRFEISQEFYLVIKKCLTDINSQHKRSS